MLMMKGIINLPLFVLLEHLPIFVLDDLSHPLDTNPVASEAHYEHMDHQQILTVWTHI